MHFLDKYLKYLPKASGTAQVPVEPGQAQVESNATETTNLPENPQPVESGSTAVQADPGIIEKSGYLKRTSTDEKTKGTWITIADDSGIARGLYQGANVTDGFAKIKGTMQTDEENKPYIQITEIKMDE